MKTKLNNMLKRWARVGAGFNVRPHSQTPDLERLLLDTARLAGKDVRLVEVAVTWLCRYYELVAVHRLVNLVHEHLEPEFVPVLGLLLDLVRQKTGTGHFNGVIALCGPAEKGRPLYEFQEQNPRLSQIARKRASKISQAWGLWVEDFALKRMPSDLPIGYWNGTPSSTYGYALKVTCEPQLSRPSGMLRKRCTANPP